MQQTAVDVFEFQSTLPRGERRDSVKSKRANYGISIHAPARGATFLEWAANEGYIDFNPRSREGSDFLVLCTDRSASNFNPRSREGSDTDPAANWTTDELFQSTLPRGERR